MKSIKLYITFLFLTFIFSSCNQVIDYDKDGEYFKNDNGVFYFKGALISGSVESHYDNGQLRFIWFFKDGKMDGEIIEYYKNGQVEEITNYKDGKPNGSYKKYLNSGELIIEKEY